MKAAVGGSFVLAAAVVASVFACSSQPDTTRVTQILAPEFAPGFTGDANRVGVSSFLERRCGTLDCHGQIGRPMRIFGSRGLRIVDDAGNVPGGNGTTLNEQYANYQAVVSLEPELMTAVENDQGGGADRLLIVRKPREMERHKGGKVVVAGDDGDTCLISWLQGATNYDACERASSIENK